MILLDSSKLGRKAGKFFLPPAQIDLVVTDSGITPEQRAALESAGIPFQVAE